MKPNEVLNSLLVFLRTDDDPDTLDREAWAEALTALLAQQPAQQEARQQLHDKNAGYRHVKNYLINDLKLDVEAVQGIIRSHVAEAIEGLLAEQYMQTLIRETIARSITGAIDRMAGTVLRTTVFEAIRDRLAVSLAAAPKLPTKADEG